jgi:glycosyltransferase involved in cell wall biosynthesis/SAM-dependent methyltransferase
LSKRRPSFEGFLLGRVLSLLSWLRAKLEGFVTSRKVAMTPSFYTALETTFRGSRDLIKSRLRVYLPFIEPLLALDADGLAVDLGCGRGEWLELLREAGFAAQGVDRNEQSTADCRARGLQVTTHDAVAFLEELPTSSRLLVSGFHVAEHLAFATLMELVQEAHRVLKPGGLLILECPNPENLVVATSSFYLDPTHQKILPPALLEFVLHFQGFERVKALRLQESPDVSTTAKSRLWSVLVGVSPDYAMVGQKGGSPEMLDAVTPAFSREYGLSLEALAAQYDQRIEARDARVESQAAAVQRDLEAAREELDRLVQDSQRQLQLVQAQHLELQALLNSKSWRVSAPLRWIDAAVRTSTPRLKRQGKFLLQRAAAHAHRHPRIARAARTVFARIPGFESRLEAGLTSQASTPPAIPDHLAQLSPRARQIYADLKAAVARSTASRERRQISAPSAALAEPRPDHRLRLAFVSPLPPERTGIADYSAELLPALASYYDIDIVVAQPSVEPGVHQHGRVRDASWLLAHADQVDRVLYHFGNSPFHAYMLPLLRAVPGTVVLHDFFLSGLMAWLEFQGGGPRAWDEALYFSHGLRAVRERHLDTQSALRNYPVNLQIVQRAEGLIVHSDYSRRLAQEWCGDALMQTVDVIPMLRSPADAHDKAAARRRLGIDERDFLVCSFGFLNWTKLNHRLLSSWSASDLARDRHCRLVFVGENQGDEYGRRLLGTIRSNGVAGRIHITGFASPQVYREYLAAADVAVQLRTSSRGETSAAVLDCMNHALALVVNANGAMAELSPDAVWMLPDAFEDEALRGALETLWREPEKRRALGEHGQELVRTRHAPAEIARRYAETIECFHRRAFSGTAARILESAAALPAIPEEADFARLASALARELPTPGALPRLLLDVTATCGHDLQTGIERVARALLLALIENPPAGYRAEPVYLREVGGEWHYHYARRYALGLLGCPADGLSDDRVVAEAGDVLLVLDFSGQALIEAERRGVFRDYRDQGAALYSVVYDLLPLRIPEVFPPGADRSFRRWLDVVSRFDGAVCISRATAEDLAASRAAGEIDEKEHRPFQIGWFHLGADLESSAPSSGVPKEARHALHQFSARPTFLMVGTVEPRKGHLQTLQAFEQLWRDGLDVNLIVAGKEGWQHLPDDMRRNIPQIIARMRGHPELNRRLFWLNGISDEYLQKVYAASSCLIFASLGEGFGLPLVEAAQRKLPIIARDMPVFREVAGEHAFYFDGERAQDLAQAVSGWLGLFAAGQHPKSERMAWLSWKESAARLVDAIVHDRPGVASSNLRQ